LVVWSKSSEGNKLVLRGLFYKIRSIFGLWYGYFWMILIGTIDGCLSGIGIVTKLVGCIF